MSGGREAQLPPGPEGVILTMHRKKQRSGNSKIFKQRYPAGLYIYLYIIWGGLALLTQLADFCQRKKKLTNSQSKKEMDNFIHITVTLMT